MLKLVDSIAGEELKIVFKKNVAAEQTARKRKFHPVEEPAVAGENFRRAVAGKIVGESKSRSDLVAPAKIYRTRKLVERGQILFLETDAEIQGQPASRLILVLDENALAQIRSLSVRSGTPERTRADRSGRSGYIPADQRG